MSNMYDNSPKTGYTEFCFDDYGDARRFTEQLTGLGIVAKDNSYALDGANGAVQVPNNTSQELMEQARMIFRGIEPKGYGR